MMSHMVAGKAVRLKNDRDYKGKPKKYKHSYVAVVEGTDEILCRCDVIGHVASNEVIFFDDRGEAAFSMKPNRKILPTKWTVTDTSEAPVGSLSQKLLGKGAWAAYDAADSEVFRVGDAASRVDKVGRALFGGASSEYCIFQGDRLIALLGKEPREKVRSKGVRGFLRALITPTDWVIRFSEDPDSPFPDLRLVIPAAILLIDITVALGSAD